MSPNSMSWRTTTQQPLHYLRSGSGPPYLLIHGLGGEACVWEPVLAGLEPHHEVVALDLPGFGRSRALPDDVTPTPRALAAAVAGLMDELGLATAHVAGNSLGGWVALELARTGRARSVTGICPAGLWGAPLARPGESPTVRGRAHRTARRLRPLIPVALLSRRVRRTILSPFVAQPDRVPYHAAWRMISSYARATAYDATSTAMRQSAFTGAAEITVPVTLAFGDRDRLIRPTRFAAPAARTVILEGCGHIPMWDDTPTITELLLETALSDRSAA
ncbi:alpha/beta fold hydrolase [Baekduia sp. Peel2402]|uniref:alpha/beta fold hydrolase n=1 Tax=Baekduia sp. Peel2402 TaxID=3458296 RepID=UPI00403EF355